MIRRLDQWPYLPRAMLFALVAVLATLVLSASDAFRRVDFDLTDMHGRWFAQRVAFDDVAVIDVDEESVAQLQPRLGPWPYDREVYALVVQWLKSAGVEAIGFDILFAEARKGDDALASALDARTVLAAAALPYTFERDGAYRARLVQKTWGAAPGAGVYPLSDLTLPHAPLTRNAGIGVISAPVDSDGILRRVPLAFAAYGQLAPSMALALLARKEEAPLGGAPQVVVGAGRVTASGKSWPVSPLSEVQLRYPANIDSLRTVPFYQVALAASGAPGMAPLADTLRTALKDRYVLIGSSSAALGDYIQTPAGRVAGVKMQAVIAQLLLKGHVLKPRSLAWEMALLGGVMLLVLAAGASRWRANNLVQWGVLPLVIVFTIVFGAVALERGQALGLLFAITAGMLAHLAGVLFQQVHLFRQNQQLAMEKRAAQQADALKSQFLSHITHELRTPLTAIMGFNNINWHDSALGREQRMKNGEIVDRNCQHMLSLVNNLLDQAKIDAGQLTIQRHPDSPNAVVRDAVATVRPLLHGKPVTLKTDDVGVPDTLDIDAFRLRQIVLNLLSNAIKFTEKGEISVVLSWNEGELTLSVIDTGPGMNADAVNRLFTAFQQADGSVAAKHGGTGLGLTISRNLARLMGGDITVRSAPGQGTVFTVTVVAAVVTPEPPAPVAAAALQGAATQLEPRAVLQGLVLVAEDMPDTRALVVRHLERLGLTVLQAENGEQAIEMALAKRPDVVLMDMDMPVVAGSEATRTLRMCGYSAPILALTAHKSEEERTRALAAGCNSIVEKPMTRASLLTALSAALAPNAAPGVKT